MKTLVTGGTGLVGARLLYDLVSAGKKVRATRRKGSSRYIPEMIFQDQPQLLQQIEWVDADITDVYQVLEALDGIEDVYHCAGKISFHRHEATSMMKINTDGTANMVNISLEKGVAKFCHVSSIAALGRVTENKTMDEKTVWKTSRHNSTYAISKYGAEREVWRGMEEGLNVVIVNPSIIIGPGDWKTGSSAMFSQVWKGNKFYSEGVNGFVDVRDVTKSMIGLMEKEIFGQRFILSAENCSYREIFDSIADALHKNRPTIRVNGTLSEVGWRVERLRSFLANRLPFITKETARNSQHKWYYSNEKVRNALGISFIPIKKSIEDCANIFMQQVSASTVIS